MIFSVIIPNYNREKAVVRALKSVFNQTFSNFEIIVVDDCSTDNSREIISKIKDDRIKLLQLPENSGAAAARNYGIKNSRGKYVSLLDSDDHYEPEFLERSYKALGKSSSEVGFSWTGVRYIEKNRKKEVIWRPVRQKNTYFTFLHSLKIGTNSGITFKREIFEKVGGFDPSLTAAEDTEFFLRLSTKFDYLIIPEVLINVEKDDGDRLSKNYYKLADAYNKFIPFHFKHIEKDRELKKKYYYKLMWLNYHISGKELARKYFMKIPDKNLKTYFIFVLYELFPLKKARALHSKLSGKLNS